MKQFKSLTFLALFVALTLTATTASDTAALATKCSQDFNKVVACMNYATGKETGPTKECCGSVEEIKSKDPICLCFLMEQTLNGSDAIKSMGIHTDRLLQLPSACKLTNASVSYCPKLLNISPNSPEYKIFTNVSSLSSSSPTTTASGASLPITNTKSNAPKFGSRVSVPISVAAVAIFFYLFGGMSDKVF